MCSVLLTSVPCLVAYNVWPTGATVFRTWCNVLGCCVAAGRIHFQAYNICYNMHKYHGYVLLVSHKKLRSKICCAPGQQLRPVQLQVQCLLLY